MMQNGIYQFLDSHEIDYQLVEHPAVYTVEEAERLVPDMPGMHIKNLLIKDKGAKHLFLLVVGGEKSVDLKALGKLLGVNKLSFASAEQLRENLGVEPGSVTLLGLYNDKAHRVEVVMDEPVWQAEALQCHPLVNTATLAIFHLGVERFLEATGHKARVLNVPSS